MRVSGEIAWMGFEIDPGLNQVGTVDISAPATAVKTFVLSVGEEQEMVAAIARLESPQFAPLHRLSRDG